MHNYTVEWSVCTAVRQLCTGTPLTMVMHSLQYAAPAIGTQVLALYRAFQFCVFLFVILYGVSQHSTAPVRSTAAPVDTAAAAMAAAAGSNSAAAAAEMGMLCRWQWSMFQQHTATSAADQQLQPYVLLIIVRGFNGLPVTHTTVFAPSTVPVQNIVYTPAGGGFFLYFTNWTFMVFGLTALSGSILTTRVSKPPAASH